MVLLRLGEVSDANHNLDVTFQSSLMCASRDINIKKGGLIAELTQALLHVGTKHSALIKIADAT